MTDTRRVQRGRNHTYLLDGAPVTGVTTIISKGVPKPALVPWATNTVAGYAVDHWDELGELPPSKRLDRLKKAPNADRDAAAKRGTEVHALAEHLIHGEAVDVPDELAGHVEAYVQFLDAWDVQPVLVERPVFSRRHAYAGTFDMVATLADGTTRLLDIKTNRSGPFGEVALQLAAYRYADFYLDHTNTEQPMPAVDSCAVVWVRADGHNVVPVEAGPEEFRAFLYAQQVAHFAERARDLIGEALSPPLSGDAA